MVQETPYSTEMDLPESEAYNSDDCSQALRGTWTDPLPCAAGVFQGCLCMREASPQPPQAVQDPPDASGTCTSEGKTFSGETSSTSFREAFTARYFAEARMAETGADSDFDFQWDDGEENDELISLACEAVTKSSLSPLQQRQKRTDEPQQSCRTNRFEETVPAANQRQALEAVDPFQIRTQETPQYAIAPQTDGQDKQQQAHQQQSRIALLGLPHTAVGSTNSKWSTSCENTGLLDPSGIWSSKWVPDFPGNPAWEGVGSANSTHFSVGRQEDDCWGRRRHKEVSSSNSDSNRCLQHPATPDEQTQMPGLSTHTVNPFQLPQVAQAAGGCDHCGISSSMNSGKTSSSPSHGITSENSGTTSQSPFKQGQAGLGNLSCCLSAGTFLQSPRLGPDFRAALLSTSWAPSCDLAGLDKGVVGCTEHVEPESYDSSHMSADTEQHDSRAMKGPLLRSAQANDLLGPAGGSECSRADLGNAQQAPKDSPAPQDNSPEALSPFWLGDDPVLELVQKSQFASIGAYILAKSSKGSAKLQEGTSKTSSLPDGVVPRSRESPEVASRLSEGPLRLQEERRSPILTVSGGIDALPAYHANYTLEMGASLSTPSFISRTGECASYLLAFAKIQASTCPDAALSRIPMSVVKIEQTPSSIVPNCEESELLDCFSPALHHKQESVPGGRNRQPVLFYLQQYKQA
ncbi:hypothetical protein, conserved [Eimeria praecox]|uniref:Uncharacterized protein n=1 Tax=Eimeria praecox TaxID=51316 RepID=U6GKS4_9EIME|nr:hypothetical protein, conserved [Eimeria praecox]